MTTHHLSFARRDFLAASAGVLLSAPALQASNLLRTADVPWLNEIQTPPKKLPKDTPRLSPVLVDENGAPITTLEGWRQKRRQVRRWWQEFLGSLKTPRGAPPKFEVLSEDRTDGMLRQRVRYNSEPGDPVEAYLLKPLSAQAPLLKNGRRPGVVVHHSTVSHSIHQPAGVKGRPEKAFGLKLARQGNITFCPRNFLWPNNNEIKAQSRAKEFFQRHPGAKGMAKMLHNSQLAVDILASLPDVDADRLGAVGHSLGAKEVLYLAALDERIKATVSSEGGVGVRFSNWDAPWYLGKSIREDDFQHDHHELLALIAPRPFFLLGGDSADGDRSWPYIEQALSVYRLYGKPARIGLFNHRKGHSVPPEAEKRIDEWLTTYLA